MSNKLPENPETQGKDKAVGLGRFPSWLHRNLPVGGNLFKTNGILAKNRLNTVCEEAKCPNRFECYSKKTATFLALGKECTRNCGFCDIDFSKTPKMPESDEPIRIANSVKELGLKHVVITMVARDDLPLGGAEYIAAIIRVVRQENPGVTIEVLTSDFSGDFTAIDRILAENPDIFNHNIETVRELSPRVRHKASYERTLSVLRYVKDCPNHPFNLETAVGDGKVTQSFEPEPFPIGGPFTVRECAPPIERDSDSKSCITLPSRTAVSRVVKSGIMVGLGESELQVKQTIEDLKNAGCDIITIGQYLQADQRKLLVKEFITPERFKAYEEYGHSIGVKQMYCGPFVRSSYNADEIQKLISQ